jgi:drug/metabolite transporter (DMT)-like permease
VGRTGKLDRHTLLGIAAIVLWSVTVALARSISERLGPLAAGAAVYLLAAGFLGVHLLVTERSFRALARLPRRYVFGCGTLFVLYTVALFLALGLAADRHQTIEVGLLNYLWPALTILFALGILGQRAGIGLIPGTLLALGGVFLVLTQGAAVTWTSFAMNVQRNPVAYGLGVFAAVAWALYSNLTRRWGGADGRGAVPLFVLATGVAFWLGHVFQEEARTWGMRVAAEVALLALATGLAYVFWDLAMRAGDVVLVASCSYFTPFLSTVVSCLYLRVRPGLGLWVGCLLIIAGSFLSWRSIRPTRGTSPQPTVRPRPA